MTSIPENANMADYMRPCRKCGEKSETRFSSMLYYGGRRVFCQPCLDAAEPGELSFHKETQFQEFIDGSDGPVYVFEDGKSYVID